LWFSKDCPSADINCMRPVPVSHSMNGRPSVSHCQTRHAFRPCRSSRLRRFAPHAASTGLLHPAASHGVRVVSATVSLQPHCCDGWSPAVFPHSHLTPSEAFPFTSSRIVSPQPFPSRRCSRILFPVSARSTSRLFSTVKSVATGLSFNKLLARCSLGLCSPSRFSPHIRMLP
jgi:hypothetical protein